MAELREVFGSATDVNVLSYVDRGGLDEKFAYHLGTQRHIAVHGGSKQGKSWLRAKALDKKQTLRIQCLVETTPETIFTEALGQLGIWVDLKRTESNDITGKIDLKASGELGLAILGKIKAEGAGALSAALDKETEAAPVGQAPASLSWVARILKESERRLVIEDFHYMAETQQRRFAFILKALGEYEVFAVIVGIWPTDHLLTYYNGDLTLRVEDIRLSWSNPELEEVLRKGSDALNIHMSPALCAGLIADAYGNVGLLQRLAEQVCLQYRVTSTARETVRMDVGTELDDARKQVASQMSGRFLAFADNFVRGMRRLKEGLAVYHHLLRTFTAATDAELVDGVDSAQLLERIHRDAESIRQSDLTQALERVERLQVQIDVNPLVLTYSKPARRVFLADRAFLFFRKYAQPKWPWDEPGEPENDLASSQPLLLAD